MKEVYKIYKTLGEILAAASSNPAIPTTFLVIWDILTVSTTLEKKSDFVNSCMNVSKNLAFGGAMQRASLAEASMGG